MPQAEIAPAVPVIEEDACCLQHVDRSGRGLWEGRGDATRVGLRRMKPDSDRVSRAAYFSYAKSTLDYITSV